MMTDIQKLLSFSFILLLTHCAKDATSELSNLQGLAGQYRSLSTTVRGITNNANSIQMAQMNSNNLINALNQLNGQLSFVTSWQKGRDIFARLIDVTNVIAQPKLKASISNLSGAYPTVDAVRTQISTIKAFVNGMTNQLETMTPDKLEEYNTRLAQATEIIANIDTFRGSRPNTNVNNDSSLDQLS